VKGGFGTILSAVAFCSVKRAASGGAQGSRKGLTMRRLAIVSSVMALMLSVGGCDSGEDGPGRDVPRTVPPASVTIPVEVQRTTPAVPLRKVRVQGTGPIYET
jgi:hypothetical protein